MTTTLNPTKLGLTDMSEADSKETNGGVWWFPIALGIALLVSAVNNTGDIRQGLSDGWNNKPPRHKD